MDTGVHTFPKGISPKVNVIARLKFELAYNDFTVQPLRHNEFPKPCERYKSILLTPSVMGYFPATVTVEPTSNYHILPGVLLP